MARPPRFPCTLCFRELPAPMLSDGVCPSCVTKMADLNTARERGAAPPEDISDALVEEARVRREASLAAKRAEAMPRLAYSLAGMRAHADLITRYLDPGVINALNDRYKAAANVPAKAPVPQAREDDPAYLARREMARRHLARRRLLPYVRMKMPNYQAGWMHKDLCRKLEDFLAAVIRKESPRLMISMPPRHGKTQLASKDFPAWALGRFPHLEFIVASYSADLANKMSRDALSACRSDVHARVFPDFALDKNAQAVTEWMTTENGAFFPTGVGGPATGRGAHIMIIDDPVKNREEAESATTRQSIKDWYTSTAYTRLAPGGGVLVIQTRWHDDDLSGWLQTQGEKDEGDQWEVVSYPAIATKDEKYRRKGEALHPDRYPIQSLMRIKKAVGMRDWNALYQQNPVPDSGDYFKREDFLPTTLAELPARENLMIYAAWDFAIGEKQHNDYTVGIVFGVDHHGDMWLLDMYRGQWSSDKIITQMFALHRRWRPHKTGGEHGHISMTLAPFIKTRKMDEGLYEFHVEPLKVGRMDKVARARAFQGRVEGHRVHVPVDAPFYEPFIFELLRFPNGKNDDIVDACAHIGMMQDTFLNSPEPPPEKKQDSWRDRLARHNAGSDASPMAA